MDSNICICIGEIGAHVSLVSTAYPDIANRVEEDEDRTRENPWEM